MINIGIIGTAGRDENIKFLTTELWLKMVETATNYIEENITDDWSKINLVSGGAAWSDHVAVQVFLKNNGSKLTLHFPCKFNNKKLRFDDNGKDDWFKNPGKSANRYHVYFRTKTGMNPFNDIKKAINIGAKIVDKYKGFHARNIEVGKVDYLIAFTFCDKFPTTGGTKFTWNNSKCENKIHFNLHKLAD